MNIEHKITHNILSSVDNLLIFIFSLFSNTSYDFLSETFNYQGHLLCFESSIEQFFVYLFQSSVEENRKIKDLFKRNVNE